MHLYSQEQFNKITAKYKKNIQGLSPNDGYKQKLQHQYLNQLDKMLTYNEMSKSLRDHIFDIFLTNTGNKKPTFYASIDKNYDKDQYK